MKTLRALLKQYLIGFCHWTPEDYFESSNFDSQCGHSFYFDDEPGPTIKFCVFCGGEIVFPAEPTAADHACYECEISGCDCRADGDEFEFNKSGCLRCSKCNAEPDNEDLTNF